MPQHQDDPRLRGLARKLVGEATRLRGLSRRLVGGGKPEPLPVAAPIFARPPKEAPPTETRRALPDVQLPVIPSPRAPVPTTRVYTSSRRPTVKPLHYALLRAFSATLVENSTIGKAGVVDESRVYEKRGRRVVDTNRPDVLGMVPTHFVDRESGRLPIETWEEYEDRVIARAPSSYDTTQIVDVDALDSKVATSLRALVESAKAEGITIGIVETRRAQERQEMLFQVGRLPGDVRRPITWTLTSEHTSGRAVDLVVNDDPTGEDPGYEWLRKNAPRYGFASIGAADPGHIAYIGEARSQE